MDPFDLKLIGDQNLPFGGYDSCADKTKVSVNSLIRGSLNMYRKRSGTWANRPGLKRRGAADATDAGVVSSFVFKTTQGNSIPLRVANNKLQFESDIVTNDSPIWYDLLETSTLLNPAVTLTRFSFATWWEQEEQANKLLMVRGDSKVLHWSGGIAKVASVQTVTGSISRSVTTPTAGGNSYAVGDVLTLVGGDATVTVRTLSGTAVATVYVSAIGSNYTNGALYTTTGGSGTGATFTAITQTTYNITKSTSSETWAEAGFNTQFIRISSVLTSPYAWYYKKLIVNGAEYDYVCGEDTDTIKGITTNITALVSAGNIVIQSVFTESLVAEIADDNFVADFIAVLNNQACYGSYTSRILHISADQTVVGTTNTELGFSNLYQSNDLVIGDPDFAILDDTLNGFIARSGNLYVSAGSSDWYEVTPNFTPPVQIPNYRGATGASALAYVITKVTKKPGSGLSGLLAHEFIDLRGNNIYYVSQDHQLRVIGTFSQLEGDQFPSVSIAVHEELKEEDFTGGHLKTIEDIVYITAPANGRHWMYQVRTDIDPTGQITAERYWHTPQASGISRVEEIDGVVYGHSNSNPQLYQIWDTQQWHDDSPADEDLAYTCVMRMAYRRAGGRFYLTAFSVVGVEGYMAQGTELLGNIYYDYQGSTKVGGIIINSEDKSARFFLGNDQPSIGGSSLGANPFGIPVLAESNEQDFLPKFRAIRDTALTNSNCFEYSIELYSEDVDSRWEILCLGTNQTKADQDPDFIRKVV